MKKTASESVKTLSDFLEWASQFNDGTYRDKITQTNVSIQPQQIGGNDEPNNDESVLDEM